MARTATAEKPKPIHHATMNRAIENGITFEEYDNGFRAIHRESGKKVTALTAKDALDKILKSIDSEDDQDGESEEGEEGKVIVKEKYKKLYQPNGGNCGDKLAKALTAFRAEDPKAFDKVCKENDVHSATWADKNKGLQWMALSNVLRHRVKRNEKVTVNSETIKAL